MTIDMRKIDSIAWELESVDECDEVITILRGRFLELGRWQIDTTNPYVAALEPFPASERQRKILTFCADGKPRIEVEKFFTNEHPHHPANPDIAFLLRDERLEIQCRGGVDTLISTQLGVDDLADPA